MAGSHSVYDGRMMGGLETEHLESWNPDDKDRAGGRGNPNPKKPWNVDGCFTDRST